MREREREKSLIAMAVMSVTAVNEIREEPMSMDYREQSTSVRTVCRVREEPMSMSAQ